MAKIKFQKKEFEKYLTLEEKTLEKINMFGTPIEISDNEVELEIFPNRPDLLSLQGFLRSFKSFIGKTPGLKKYKIHKPEKDYKVIISPSVNQVRPFTACAIVKNLDFTNESIKEIIDLQEKLHSTIGRNRKKVAIGIYPLEKIKLPIRYEALPPDKIIFTPLESDRELSAIQILQKHPTGKEYAHLLSGFQNYPVFLDSNKKILSMPPIINSNETGRIIEDTKEVFIECSGSDLSVLKKTLNIIITTLSDLGGHVYQMSLEYPKQKIITPDLKTETLKISLENTNSLLGLKLKESDLQKLLPRMGYDYKKGKVNIPAWRTDILHEVDIIEDIAIAYGYDSLIPAIPKISTIGEESLNSKIERKIAEILAGLNLIETSSYHLIKHKEAEISKMKNLIELQDSKTDFKFLRPNLLIPALRILAENKDNEYPQNFFELGTSFSLKESKESKVIKETPTLIIISSPGNFTYLKQILDYLARMLSISYEIKPHNKKELIDGRTGAIIINNKEIGYIGELHPDTLRDFNIKMPASVIEISLEEIFNILETK